MPPDLSCVVKIDHVGWTFLSDCVSTGKNAHPTRKSRLNHSRRSTADIDRQLHTGRGESRIPPRQGGPTKEQNTGFK